MKRSTTLRYLRRLDTERIFPIPISQDPGTIIELELLNFSTRTPHKLASCPKIHLATTITLASGRLGISLEVVGDNLALLLFHMGFQDMVSYDHFFLFDWKKGTLKVVRLPYSVHQHFNINFVSETSPNVIHIVPWSFFPMTSFFFRI
jgi:hypothetical protein